MATYYDFGGRLPEQWPGEPVTGYPIENLCKWCQADYYVDGRCQRCGQALTTNNEVGGRPFRMTWSSRSPHGHGWTRPGCDDVFPRMPATRNVIALRQMVWFARETTYIGTIVEAQRQYLLEAIGEVLFGVSVVAT